MPQRENRGLRGEPGVNKEPSKEAVTPTAIAWADISWVTHGSATWPSQAIHRMASFDSH